MALVTVSTCLGAGWPLKTATAATESSQSFNRFNPNSQASTSVHFTAARSTLGQTSQSSTGSSQLLRSPAMPMQAGTVSIDPTNGAAFVGSDGRLEISVPSAAISSADVAAAGGKVALNIRQIAPASGSNAGGSGHVSFGTFLMQLVDASGQLLSHGLAQPIRVTVHLAPNERALNLDHLYAVLNGSLPDGMSLNPDPNGPSLTPAQAGLGSSTTQALALNSPPAATGGSATSASPFATPQSASSSMSLQMSSPSVSMSFNTNAPIATFGKPDPYNVDLSAGSLTAGYPIQVPPGPGGLTPPLQLGYSSAAVAEQHNPQGAAPWVGEGWNMSLGSISWSEHDTAAGCEVNGTCSSPNWQNSWELNDAYGTAVELIPPTSTTSTFNDDTGHSISPSPITWHTAPETHAKVESFGGAGAVSDPAAVSWGANRIDFFVRGADNAIWHDWWNNGWGSWESLQGYLTSAPAAASWGVNRLDVFAVDGSGNVTHKAWDGTSWSTWGSIGSPPGGAASDPAAVSWGSNRIDVYVRGTDNAIWHDWWNGAWGTWQSLGGNWTSAPGVSSWGVNRLDVFVRGTDNQLWHQAWNGSTGAWESLGSPPGGQITSRPSAVSWGANRIDVFARGTDNALWHTSWSGVWNGWDSLGGALISGPGAASWGSGRLDVFARFSDNGVYHRGYQSGWAGWDYLNAPPIPCFRVFLPNGTMEEFGCVPGALQYYPVPTGTKAGVVYLANWLLDLITDPRGNQIHVNYQLDLSSGVGGYQFYPRDAVLSAVEYDSPNCRDSQRACTDAAWAPLLRVNFVAGHSVAHVSGSSCAANGNLRCDDPVDLSSSNGLAAPSVQSTFVLNDIQVQVRGSPTSTWNTLRTYRLSYDQGAAVTPPQPDPATGKNESTAGRLNLTQLTEIGSDGTTTLPARSFSYIKVPEYYEDDAYHPIPTTNCGPVWNTGNGTGCLLWSQSYEGNSYYLTSVSNGLGLQQTFSWVDARNNTGA